jgi:spoIIIJ-associated protein
MDNNHATKIEALKEICEELLRRMNIEARIETRIELDDDLMEEQVIIHFHSSLAHLLIGQGGANMDALQYIIRMMYRKKYGEAMYFTLDVNNYRRERRDLLKQLALSSAHKVVSSGEKIMLRPMSSYERRVIHNILGKHDDVITESTGESPGRRVVVKPKNN